MLGVRIVKAQAFGFCSGLMDVEFGDKLERIERYAFQHCSLLTNIKMPTVRIIGKEAFGFCGNISDVEFGEALETLHEGAFNKCSKLERIALPLKDDIIEDGVFHNCTKLTTVDLVGGTHSTVASLHYESLRNEMNNEINLINHVLPNKELGPWKGYNTPEIQPFMKSVIQILDAYKAEQRKILKEATTLVELAVWMANLVDNGEERLVGEGDRPTTKLDAANCYRRLQRCLNFLFGRPILLTVRETILRERELEQREEVERAREELRVTSGADVVIKNVRYHFPN